MLFTSVAYLATVGVGVAGVKISQSEPCSSLPTRTPYQPPPGATVIPIPRGGGPITFRTGWNLISGLPGTFVCHADGPLYTLQDSDADYEPIWPESPDGMMYLQPGVGYWVYFDQPTDVYFGGLAPPGAVTRIPIPAGHYVMIGGPSASGVIVSGADVVYTYGPSDGYQATNFLRVGEGAFAYSSVGGTLTLTSR